MNSRICTLKRHELPLRLAIGSGIQSPLIVQLLCIANEHLLAQNDLRFLLAERALIVMILRRIEVCLDLECSLLLHIVAN